MAFITPRMTTAGFNAFTGLADLFGRVSAWNDARVTRASLTKLTDRELDDLGLVRGDIDAIAEGTFRR